MYVYVLLGIPSTPTDLVVLVNLSQPGLQLSWTPGFTFVNEVVTYIVTVPSLQISEIEVTSPSLFIPSQEGLSCPRYNLTVEARNIVGRSNGSLRRVEVAPTGEFIYSQKL